MKKQTKILLGALVALVAVVAIVLGGNSELFTGKFSRRMQKNMRQNIERRVTPPVPTPAPDLIVEGFLFSIDDGVRLIATPILKNIGTAAVSAGAIEQNFHYKDALGNQRTNWTVPGVSDSTASISAGTYVEIAGDGPSVHHCRMRNLDGSFAVTQVYGVIDPSNYVVELNEANNVLTFEIPASILATLGANPIEACMSSIAPGVVLPVGAGFGTPM